MNEMINDQYPYMTDLQQARHRRQVERMQHRDPCRGDHYWLPVMPVVSAKIPTEPVKFEPVKAVCKYCGRAR